MLRSNSHLAAHAIEHRPPVAELLTVAAILGAALALAASMVLGGAALPLSVFAASVMIAVYGLVHSYEHRALGLCNIITLSRLAVVAFLTGTLLVPQISPWIVFGVAGAAFALDGIDGWLARRSGLVSDFGARFDMETDAALAAVISIWLLVSGTTGPEILILGFMRYGFVAASLVWPALQAPLPLPQAFRRKAICVLQIATLLALVLPLTPQGMIAPAAFFAATLLSWSFLVDILWLARRAS